jgi:hypothetical protein
LSAPVSGSRDVRVTLAPSPVESDRPLGSLWSRADIVAIAAIALASLLFIEWYLPRYRAAGGLSQFYQDQFAPAVMLACGRGFESVDPADAPALASFLKQQAAEMRCEDLPATLSTIPLNGFQGTTRYLMTAVSHVWRVRGISWRSLDPLLGAFVAVTAAAAYGAIRMVCGRTVSVFVVAFWLLSPRHLENVPHLRDYSKAPFFFFMLIAMGIAVTERRVGRLIALSLTFGVVQGLGFGMRTDVLLNFIPFFVVLFLAAPEGFRRNLEVKFGGAVAAIAVFAAVSYPVVKSYAQNSSLWHIVLLGFTSPYDENLNVGFPRPAYSFPYAHNDTYIEGVVRAYWRRLHPEEPLVNILTRPYDRACRDYFGMLARTFPGDMLTRGVASMARVAGIPFWLPEARVPVGVSTPALVWLWERRIAFMRSFEHQGPVLMAGVIALVGTQGLRYACIAFLLFSFWAAVPVIEFQGRHIFHLEFVVLAGFAWGVTILWRLIQSSRTPGAWRATRTRALKSIATTAMLVAVVGAAVALARAVQIRQARTLVMSYAGAPTIPLEATATPVGNDQVRLAVDLFHPEWSRDAIEEVMIEAEFDFARCGTPPMIPSTFRYDTAGPAYSQFSREISLDYLGPTPTRVFLPVYSVVRDWTVLAQFAGLDVPAAFAGCVRLSRVADTRALPLLMPVTIEPDWPRKLYQRVRLGTGLGF